MRQITDIVVNGIVAAGGFRLLIEFVVENCEDLTMDTAWLLTYTCPNLATLGNMNSWPTVASYEIQSLLNLLRNDNLSLYVSERKSFPTNHQQGV